MKHIVMAVTNDLVYDQRAARICGTLAGDGYTVTLIGRHRRKSPPLRDAKYRQKRFGCIFQKGPLFYAEYNFRLLLILMFFKFDIGVACDLDTAVAVILSTILKGRKSVFDAHEFFEEVPELEGKPVVRNIWRLIARMTLSRFDLRYTVGPSLAEALSRRYRVPFEVARNVPRLAQSAVLPLKDRDPVIFYQGALNAGRGLECAIDAMAHIEGYTLVLAGEGDLSRSLRARVRAQNLDDKVIFLGMVTPDDLPVVTKRALIGLNLLDAESKSYYYSLANKFFDYIHAGVPSVNMDFPEYRDIVRDMPVGICIASLEPGQYAAHVRALLDDEARLEQMIGACEEARLVFHWEREEEELLGMYRKL